jgi:hypothetical protein
VKKLEGEDDDSSHLVISKEVFVVQDARPLYHHPEVPNVPVTAHDNWEPQFKPAVVEPVEVEPAPQMLPDETNVAAGEVSLDGDEEEEDDDESDMTSQQSSLVKKATPTNKTHAHAAAIVASDTSALGTTVEGVESEEQHLEGNTADDLGGVEDQHHSTDLQQQQQHGEELLSGEGDVGSALDDPNQSQDEANVEGEQSAVSDQT